ncbi:MAG: efflux RND transporter permease subunit, partial [Mailhella sp.]|nr:efflux RND transporter permease subunit [Mailhella sp.]
MNTNISAGFIKRPVATTLLMLVMVIFGILAYTRLPISDYPNMETPFIIVVARLPGADPETMATSVAKPLEKNFSAISGLKNMSSINKQNMTLVILEFQTDKPIDSAALDVQSNLGRAYSSMPDAMTTQPFFIKMNPDSMPILQLSLTSDTISPRELTDYAENYLAQQLTMIKGVSQANVFGAKRYAVRVELDPDRMLARNVGVDEVKAAISYANPSLPTGVLRGEARIFNITVDGGLKEVDEFANIIVSWRNGAPIRLSDVANVVEGVENKEQGSWLNGTPGITVGVTKQPGGNTVQVVNDVLDILPAIEASLPPAVELSIVENTAIPIIDSVKEVEFTLLLTILLVVIVIYAFLRDGMATIIPSLALPLSVVATFPLMLFSGFSLDNMSLMALILVVGFVVDDAIVMLENIIRHREMGKS